MKTVLVILMLMKVASLLPLAAAEPVPVARKELLDADIAVKAISRVAVKEITLAPAVAGGLHLHPVPVIGVVTAGEITFQIEGQPAVALHAGDAFYEPANARIARFENASTTT